MTAPPRAPGELAGDTFIRLEALGRERLASAIAGGLSRAPGEMLSRPLLHDDDWRLIIAALRASGDGDEAMREALSECILQIEYEHEKFGGTGSGETVLARARATIAERDRVLGVAKAALPSPTKIKGAGDNA